MASRFNVAIIGAGLSGLALALALHNESIPCTLYEGRNAPLDTGGGMNLTPNGLKVLKNIGVYDALVDSGFTFDNMYLQSGPTGAIVETLQLGNIEKFDGTRESASLLVGADGIHSTVRRHVAPEVVPQFAGNIFLVAAVPIAQLELPSQDFVDLTSKTNKHPLPSAILVPGLGAFVSAPQTRSGDDLMITVMKRHAEEPENGRWSALENDKDALRAMFRESIDMFPQAVQNAVRNIPAKDLRVWPAYHIPRLKSWTSMGKAGGLGRVCILGDAAHAIPPSGGQGVNQAFEDVHILAKVLGRVGDDVHDNDQLRKALLGWQLSRQTRVDTVLEYNKQAEIRRLPAAKQVEQGVDLQSLIPEMARLTHEIFGIDYDKAIENALYRGEVSA